MHLYLFNSFGLASAMQPKRVGIFPIYLQGTSVSSFQMNNRNDRVLDTWVGWSVSHDGESRLLYVPLVG
jgi:hypothetical protein